MPVRVVPREPRPAGHRREGQIRSNRDAAPRHPGAAPDIGVAKQFATPPRDIKWTITATTTVTRSRSVGKILAVSSTTALTLGTAMSRTLASSASTTTTVTKAAGKLPGGILATTTVASIVATYIAAGGGTVAEWLTRARRRGRK